MIVAILITVDAYAKSASEVFEIASKSTVVVLGYDAKGKASSLGSGVVMPDGAVATNCHVIEKGTRLAVRYQNREYSASKRYTDRDRDACTLNVIGLNAPAIRLGTTRSLKVGARVYAIGAPQGLELTLSEGIVSSLREIGTGHYIQTTAPISPGSSGGGLFDHEGRLLGLTSFYLAKGQNLNFALPVEWINELPKRHNEITQKTTRTTEWITKGLELQAEKNWPEMIAHGQRWVAIESKNAIAWFSLGIAYHKSGQAKQAAESYQQALQINPKYAGAWYNLGIVYSESGQHMKAIECYQQAVHINPEYSIAWYNLAIDYGKSGEAEKAIECYQQALHINPQHADSWYNLGSTYSKLGQTIKAIECYQQALRINPEYVNAWDNLGQTYSKSAQYAKAIECHQQALRINPEHFRAWTNLGHAYHQSGQTIKAIECFRQALRINPEYTIAWYNLGTAYNADGQRKGVIEVYNQLKSLDPIFADKFFNEIVLR